jgi:diguanylate cyclase (GGDEF)-like protein/PAS domain S-box-containing protein
MTTGPTLRLLFAEDNSDDAELQLRELKRAGLKVVHRVVDSKAKFESSVREFAPDVILSDFTMPSFDGMEALRLAVELAPDTPFIFVSATLGEDYAVRALRNGATDYVLKTNLIRLPAAVERALLEAETRRARRRTEMELEIARERLREREAGLARAQHLAKLAHVITGSGGAFKTWSDTLSTLIGVEQAQMPRSTREWLELVHPEDRVRFRAASIEAGETRGRRDVDYRLKHKSGAWIHVRQVIEPLETERGAGAEERWFNTLLDVTEHKQTQDRIRRLNRVYAVLSSTNSLIVRVRKRDELFEEACRIAVEAGQFRMAWLGVYNRATKTVEPVARHGHEEGFVDLIQLAVDGPLPEGRGLVRRALREKQPVIINDIEHDAAFRLRPEALARGYRSGAVLPLMVAGEPIGVLALFADEAGFFDEEENRLLTQLAGDISFALDHIEKAEKLDYLAFYDGLTGLANRTLFLEHLNQYMRSASESGTKLAVIVTDLERFRAVNDSLGRPAGDSLLKQFSERLLGSVADEDQLSRLGADHFAIVLPSAKNALDAARLLGQLADASLARPFQIADAELRVAAKAGLALYPEDGTDGGTLLRNAEAALNRSKRTGERYLFFESTMTQRVAENLNLENRLRRALEREEFVLHYQPRVDLETRRITGVEALIRWQSETGLVPPAQFIPLMEETGLILEVGAWALRRAVLDHRGWLEQGIPAPRVAVNVSAVQLRQRDFVSQVRRAVEQGVTPPALDLEITESMVMEDVAGVIEKLRALRELGLSIAIDDFGTGYSSLAYLARLPVAALKIDRSFIIAMLDDANTMTVVSTIVSLAHSLNLKVVAEGVQSEEQAQRLLELRCDEMQGYLFSTPLPSAELVALLRAGESCSGPATFEPGPA